MNSIFHGDNLDAHYFIGDESISLVYIDPPFNTGKKQVSRSGKYTDTFDNYLGFLSTRIEKYIPKIKENGSFFFHIDYREAHYVKVMLDSLFGRQNFMNEIIWAYDYGARQKNKWPTKHDTIFWYVKNNKDYIFNYDAVDRIPYLAPGLVGKEKSEKGKTLTDVWWNTIVPTMGTERTGYPTQKPLAILERIIKVHSHENDVVLDFFAGSGSFGEAAAKNNRRFILIDNNPEAITTMKQRLEKYETGIYSLVKET